MEKEYIAETEKIEAILKGWLPAFSGDSWFGRVFPAALPAALAKPEQAEPLLKPGEDLFMRGGKRWRPLLAHLVCRALGGGDAALPLLPLVEFTHNASLIHDDLEDNSDQRRGKPAVHLIYGNDTAVNSGSFLYFLPLAALETWEGPAEVKNRLWQLWAGHVRCLHLGQSMDIAWHRDPACIPSLDDYMVMCGLKTGSLAGFAARLGVEAACSAVKTAPRGSKHEECAVSLGEAAQKLGVGFQILDDVKNLQTGNPGKKRGDDVVEGKKSLPVLLFLSKDSGGGTPERAAFVRRCFAAAGKGGVHVPEVEEFIAALIESGVLAEAEKRGKALIDEAGAVFSALPAADSEAKRLLAGITELLR